MPSKWGNRLFCPVSSPQAISLTSTGYLTSYKRDKEKKFAWVSENPTPKLKKKITCSNEVGEQHDLAQRAR